VDEQTAVTKAKTCAWTDSRYCASCESLSSYFTSRSHCRVCGQSVCQDCVRVGDVKWLTAPFVRLCAGIPETHRTSMKVCAACFASCREREETWMWACQLPALMLHGVHAAEWRRMAAEPARAKQDQGGQEDQGVRTTVLARCARKLLARFASLTAPSKLEFANKGYRTTPLDQALLATTPRLHVFDIVHRTPKFLSTPPNLLQLHSLPLHIVMSILHQPATKEVIQRCCEEQPATAEDEDAEPCPRAASPAEPDIADRAEGRAAADYSAAAADRAKFASPNHRSLSLVRRAALPVVLPFAAACNRNCMLSSMSRAQRAAAYLHDRPGAVVSTEWLGPMLLQQLEQHRNNLDVLRMISLLTDPKDAAEKESLASDFRQSKQAALFYHGKTHRLLHMRFPRRGVAEVMLAPNLLLTVWLEGVDRRLIIAAAFASYSLYRTTFQKTAALPFEPHVERAPVAPAALIRPSVKDRNIDCPPNPGTLACPTSLFVQSLLLTVLQVATGQLVDRARARYLVDGQGRLLFYSAPLLPKAAAGASVAAAQPTALDTHAQQVVRKACTNLFRTNREYIFWLGYILTGTKRHFRPIAEDSPFIYLV
jgi:hypothetical protein